MSKDVQTSSRNIDHNIKNTAVYFIVHMMGYFLSPCSLNSPSVFAFFYIVSSDHRSQSHLKFQSCLITEYNGDCFWMREDNVSWNPPKQHVVMWCCLTIVFKVFWPWDATIFCYSPAVILVVFSLSNSPPHRVLGRYRHMSSSRQFLNILCWL